jgi:hypothetical protein
VSKSQKAHKKPLNADEIYEVGTRLLQTLANEPPLQCVVLSGAYLEQHLVTLLASFLIEGYTSNALLQFEGYLGQFQAKADLAYALGLIPKFIYQNFRIIGQIRNRFAHSHDPLSFEDPEILKLISGTSETPGLFIPGECKVPMFDGAMDFDFSKLQEYTGGKRFRAAIDVMAVVLDVLTKYPSDGVKRRPRFLGD